MTIQHLWATPVYRKNINDPELVNRLINEILCDPDATSNNACLLSSQKVSKLIEENDGLFSEVVKHLSKATDDFFKEVFGVTNVKYIIESFYLTHKQGGNVKYHNHPGSSLTGILYLNVPSGDLVLVDPRTNANRGIMREIINTGHFSPVVLTPEAGEIIMFPSYVHHYAFPNVYQEPRIVLPFDVNSLDGD